MFRLRNSQTVSDVRLDRIYQEDWNSLNYTVDAELIRTGTPVYRPRSFTWGIDEWLNQLNTDGCVGFSFAQELIARPQEVTGVNWAFAHDSIYHAAQHRDPWAGCYLGDKCPISKSSGGYGGTSILAGAQVCQNLGFYESYHWALTTEELARGVAYFGPAVIGVNWYDGMFTLDVDGFIRPTGGLAGGHAILVHAVKIVYKSWWKWWERTWRDVDWDKSYLVVHNSWGRTWGRNGRAKISFRDMDRLLAESGDACFPKRTDKRAV